MVSWGDMNDEVQEDEDEDAPAQLSIRDKFPRVKINGVAAAVQRTPKSSPNSSPSPPHTPVPSSSNSPSVNPPPARRKASKPKRKSRAAVQKTTKKDKEYSAIYKAPKPKQKGQPRPGVSKFISPETVLALSLCVLLLNCFTYWPHEGAIRECRWYQKNVGLLLLKTHFRRLCKEITMDFRPTKAGETDFRFQLRAIMALQEACDAFMIRLFEFTNVTAIQAKRVTIQAKDVLHFRHREQRQRVR